MPQPLPNIPSGSDIFIDANIFVNGLNKRSTQCRQLLERCSREEVTGISLFEIVNEATHVLMMAEARSKGLATDVKTLRKKPADISTLISYWHDTEKILALNLLFFSTDEQIVRNAQPERRNAGIMTNDSMILSCMREYGLRYLATSDGDFDNASGITVFRPDDL